MVRTLWIRLYHIPIAIASRRFFDVTNSTLELNGCWIGSTRKFIVYIQIFAESNEKYPFTILRHAIVDRIEKLPFHIVARFVEFVEKHNEDVLEITIKQAFHVFY